MNLIRLIAISVVFASTASAQENTSDGAPPYTATDVFKQAMSDTGLAGYEMLVSRLDLIPGGVDSTPHRHDADLFVYVIQGSVEIELGGEKSTHNAGTMFHEPRNTLHSLLRNTSDDEPASILAVFVIKNDREAFLPETK